MNRTVKRQQDCVIDRRSVAVSSARFYCVRSRGIQFDSREALCLTWRETSHQREGGTWSACHTALTTLFPTQAIASPQPSWLRYLSACVLRLGRALRRILVRSDVGDRPKCCVHDGPGIYSSASPIASFYSEVAFDSPFFHFWSSR